MIIVFCVANRQYQLVCSPSKDLVQSAYSSYPLSIAIGTGVLFGLQLILLALGLSCVQLRRAFQRSAALSSVRSFFECGVIGCVAVGEQI